MVEKNTQKEEKSWRKYVGGLWHEMGELQFRFLTDKGLRPNHVLIDIACGSLRAGTRLIPYLNKTNYLGLDINEELVEQGKKMEVGDVMCEIKEPEFVISDSFEFSRFSKRGDFAIAQSIFTHLTKTDMALCLKNLRGQMNDGATLYATFFQIPEPRENPSRSHPHEAFRYTLHEMDELGTQTGWNVKYIGSWNHPRDQKMLCYVPA